MRDSGVTLIRGAEEHYKQDNICERNPPRDAKECTE